MKTFKSWENSGKDLDDYLGAEPCRIDEKLYMYIIEVVSAHFSTFGHGQLGECEFEKQGIDYHMTVRHIGEKHWYLGILPAYKN